MHTRFCVLALTVLLAGASGSAQVTSPPAARPANAQASAPDYTQEAFVLEQVRTSYRFENDGTGRREHYARVKVQSDAGVKQWGQLVFGYNASTERIDIEYVRVHKAGGVTVTAPADAAQDLSSPVEREAPIYTDYRQKHITVPSLRPGETLEFNIAVTMHTPLAAGHFWMQHDFRTLAVVLDERLDVDVPVARPLTLKTTTGFTPAISDAGGRRVYRWTSSQKTPSAQHAKELEATLKDEEERPAPIRLTTFQSWEEIGKWYAGIEQKSRTPTPELRAKAEELTAGKKTSLEKMEALYDYVALNFRYVSLSLGVGRYQPRAAADVYRDQYGDCKDKHTLLASLMESIGLHADTVLINSSEKLDPEFPSPGAFDHVITRADVDGQAVWVDVTTEVAPFRLLSQGLRKKQALVVSRPSPHLEETPANPPMANAHTVTIDGKVADDGTLTGRVVHSFRGDAELALRGLFRQIPTARWKDFLTEFDESSGLGGEVGDYKISDPAATKQAFTVEYEVTKAGFADRTRKTSSLMLPHAGMELPEQPEPDDAIEFGSPVRAQYRLRLEFGDGFNVRAPQSVTVGRDYGDYKASYTVDGRIFTAERTLDLRVGELPAAKGSDYAAFLRVVTADEAQRLALEMKGAPIPAAAAAGTAAGGTASATELMQQGLEMVLRRGDREGLALLQRATELEPRHRTVWLALGTAQMGFKNFDAAIAAFQKQIELDPFHDKAYSALGTVYRLQRRFSDAEAAFKKQLEVNPLDPTPQQELVSLYMETERYSDAIPLLERAAGVAGAQAGAHVSLGNAYLNVGRTDEAVASFDKAIDLSPTPMIWNNVAYHLSEKGQRLDRAQQYAESAVTSVSVESRNITLSRVTSRDVNVMGSLASYWDTLGWVAFMKGDLSRAEHLLTAAWRLSESGVIGDHLAQTYEKQGRRDLAIRTYAAVAGLGPDLDSATRDRLRKLVKTDAEVKRLEDLHRSDPSTMRTVSVKSAGGTGTAVFNILLGPNGVEDVAFISGDEALRGHAAAVRSANFKDLLPINDAVPAKLLRQGALACSPNRSNRTDCVFVLFPLAGMRVAPAANVAQK